MRSVSCIVCCSLFAVRGSLFDARCLLSVVSRDLCVVGCMLFVVCSSVRVDCCLLCADP